MLYQLSYRAIGGRLWSRTRISSLWGSWAAIATSLLYEGQLNARTRSVNAAALFYPREGSSRTSSAKVYANGFNTRITSTPYLPSCTISWCQHPDLNRDDFSVVFETTASANSAMLTKEKERIQKANSEPRFSGSKLTIYILSRRNILSRSVTYTISRFGINVNTFLSKRFIFFSWLLDRYPAAITLRFWSVNMYAEKFGVVTVYFPNTTRRLKIR